MSGRDEPDGDGRQTMPGAAYYAARLSGDRLRLCYELAPRRVRQYLDAELAHVLDRVQAAERVLELGCGYGRVLCRLGRATRRAVGVDTSIDSVVTAARELVAGSGSTVAVMDAASLGFRDAVFDAVVCIQNGICAFRVDPTTLLREALRVTRPGGSVLLSSYTDAFWPQRLRWFELQAAAGLVGEIDHSATTRGHIVCKDGFGFGTFGPSQFARLCDQLGVRGTLVEVDGSSLFCEIERAAPEPGALSR